MKIGNKITNPGELKTLITLQSVTLTKAAGGTQQRTYADLPSSPKMRVKWTNAHGGEALQAAAMQVRSLATVLMRYRADVTAQTIILKGGQRYEIVGQPDNIGERGEYMELKVQLVKGGA